MIDEAGTSFTRPAIGERDLLTINYTSGTTSRPKGVMITHRNAWMNSVGMLAHYADDARGYLSVDAADVSRQRLDVHVDRDCRRRDGTSACRSSTAPTVFRIAAEERVTRMCAAPTVLIMLASAPAEVKALAPKGVGVMTAGAPPAAVTIQRIEGELGWNVIQIYGLTETAPAISICEPQPAHAALSQDERARIKARQGVELITSGELRVVDDQGRDSAGRRQVPRRDCRARQRGHGRLLQRSGSNRALHGRRLVPYR